MAQKLIDIKNKRYGRLVVIDRDGSIKTEAAWACRCDCGKPVRTTGSRLRSGYTASCGCLKSDNAKISIRKIVTSMVIDIGTIFSWLTVVQQDGKLGTNSAFLCQCHCGNMKRIRGSHLVSGHTTSCGCEFSTTRKLQLTTHGQFGTHIYRVWSGMIQRCENQNAPTYKKYGAKGITVCESWHTFENFLSDMGQPPSNDHTLDRMDGIGNYEPSNCRWATQTEQQNNRSDNRILAYMGKSQTLAEWARELDINQRTIESRLRRSWSDELALATPVRRRLA